MSWNLFVSFHRIDFNFHDEHDSLSVENMRKLLRHIAHGEKWKWTRAPSEKCENYNIYERALGNP